MSFSDVEKLAAFQLLIAACNRIEADAEEGETDDGLAVMIPLDLWHQFTDAMDHARAQDSVEVQGIKPYHSTMQLAEMVLSDCGHSTVISDRLQRRVAERIQHYLDGIQTAQVPDELPAERSDWTMGQWAEHFGGRHKDDNPVNYYEFGSLMAVSAMLQRFGLVQRQVGWNLCRKAMLDAMPVRIDLEGQ